MLVWAYNGRSIRKLHFWGRCADVSVPTCEARWPMTAVSDRDSITTQNAYKMPTVIWCWSKSHLRMPKECIQTLCVGGAPRIEDESLTPVVVCNIHKHISTTRLLDTVRCQRARIIEPTSMGCFPKGTASSAVPRSCIQNGEYANAQLRFIPLRL